MFALPIEAPKMIRGPIAAHTTPAVEKRADILSYFFCCAVSPFLPASEACSDVDYVVNNIGGKMNEYKQAINPSTKLESDSDYYVSMISLSRFLRMQGADKPMQTVTVVKIIVSSSAQYYSP